MTDRGGDALEGFAFGVYDEEHGDQAADAGEVAQYSL
jgi:hypothetical protein